MNNTDGNEPATVGLPRHIAVIMDGNNRWARARGERGATGHRMGAEVARDLVFSCADKGIEYLTLFAFSSENWLRPKKEVLGLMALFLSVLQRQEIQMMHKRNVRLKFIGNRSSFSPRLQKHMRDVEELTRDNTGLVVTVAADYGGRWDIAQAAAAIAEAVKQGQIDSAMIDVDTLQQYISMSDTPDPDLCIRTGGEQRISNFLLWQFAYTELYFTECYWPDFDQQQFELALEDFRGRKRRFGRESGTDERP
ncbi:polyprenyl diphosphate synthase [Pseudohongiella spirulinae]|uniref:Ditrans,polycis-undecaprenyl-diphosphate synthase ((2E,6E)-farnesyl-diphosphate specific) n=1 Tax=Pseudohongiella spirulinae TaxID=1249552 RepID=A0A0S2KCR7_9GAMM|nr:polyprenyl diphosphate synthase [Pseudohongiella spirulinae]ALO46041.1 Ditrans,polycis-undecaprenyl-diphosphate synthase ((2E,6E)-farnesyl-diphosphate specific) [Pseudohongiella spirulinae]